MSLPGPLVIQMSDQLNKIARKLPTSNNSNTSYLKGSLLYLLQDVPIKSIKDALIKFFDSNDGESVPFAPWNHSP